MEAVPGILNTLRKLERRFVNVSHYARSDSKLAKHLRAEPELFLARTEFV